MHCSIMYSSAIYIFSWKRRAVYFCVCVLYLFLLATKIWWFEQWRWKYVVKWEPPALQIESAHTTTQNKEQHNQAKQSTAPMKGKRRTVSWHKGTTTQTDSLNLQNIRSPKAKQVKSQTLGLSWVSSSIFCRHASISQWKIWWLFFLQAAHIMTWTMNA
jgi:hypothetical protein